MALWKFRVNCPSSLLLAFDGVNTKSALAVITPDPNLCFSQQDSHHSQLRVRKQVRDMHKHQRMSRDGEDSLGFVRV